MGEPEIPGRRECTGGQLRVSELSPELGFSLGVFPFCNVNAGDIVRRVMLFRCVIEPGC